MFARIVTVNLKPGEGSGYARMIEQEVIPILRKFAGFRDEIAMVSTDGKQAVGMSLWERREDADAYSRDSYADVLKAMEKHIEGKPVLVTYDVTTSTAHAIETLKAQA